MMKTIMTKRKPSNIYKKKLDSSRALVGEILEEVHITKYEFPQHEEVELSDFLLNPDINFVRTSQDEDELEAGYIEKSTDCPYLSSDIVSTYLSDGDLVLTILNPSKGEDNLQIFIGCADRSTGLGAIIPIPLGDETKAKEVANTIYQQRTTGEKIPFSFNVELISMDNPKHNLDERHKKLSMARMTNLLEEVYIRGVGSLLGVEFGIQEVI